MHKCCFWVSDNTDKGLNIHLIHLSRRRRNRGNSQNKNDANMCPHCDVWYRCIFMDHQSSSKTKKPGVQLHHNRLWYFQQTCHVSTNLCISIFLLSLLLLLFWYYVLNVKQVEMINAQSLFQSSSSGKENEVLPFSLRLTSYQVNLKNHCTETKPHNHEVWLKTSCHVEPAALLCPGGNQELIHLFWHKCRQD